MQRTTHKENNINKKRKLIEFREIIQSTSYILFVKHSSIIYNLLDSIPDCVSDIGALGGLDL